MTPIVQTQLAQRPLPPLPIHKPAIPLVLSLKANLRPGTNDLSLNNGISLKKVITPENGNVQKALEKATTTVPLDIFEKKRVNWAIIKGLAQVTFGLLCIGGATAGGVIAILGGGIPGIVGGSLAIGFGSAFGLSRIHQGLSLIESQTQNPTAKAFLKKLCGIQSAQTEKTSAPQLIEIQPDRAPPPMLPNRPQNAELLTKLTVLKEENKKLLHTIETTNQEVDILKAALKSTQQPVRVQVLPGQEPVQRTQDSKTILLEELKAMKFEDEERIKLITNQTQEINSLRKALEEALASQGNVVSEDDKLQNAEKEVQALTLASVHLDEELARKERKLDLLNSRIQAMENGTKAPAAPLLPPPPPPMPASDVSTSPGFGQRPASFLSDVRNAGIAVLRKTPAAKKDPTNKKDQDQAPQSWTDILKNHMDKIGPALNGNPDEESGNDDANADW